MNKLVKYLLFTILLVVVLGCFAQMAGKTESTYILVEEIFDLNEPDSLTPRFPVDKTQKTRYQDFKGKRAIDFETPQNVKTEIEYDPKSGLYIFRTKIGDSEVSAPFSMSADEYMSYTLKRSMSKYFRDRDAALKGEKDDDKSEFSLKNIKLNIGPAERLFGPGGVKFHATGYVEAKLGIKRTTSDNPTRSERNRSRTAFDFDEDIQLNVTATVGDKINFDMNYDTQAMFDFDSKRIKLAYDASAAGDDDAILRKIEAGNVSMTTTNSLIQGGSALFGIATELQFGKLRINSVISQQEAEARSTSTNGGMQKTEFEFKADKYDENRHFFLGHYFRDNYDRAMSKLPIVLSGVNITKMEVWVTNSRQDPSQARSFVAFADLAETKHIKNTSKWHANGATFEPFNAANNLHSTVATTYSAARDINQVNAALTDALGLVSGLDYEKVESARLLGANEYFYSPQLGYISLMSALQPDEVLAVAFSYKLNGKDYQVGEFSSDIVDKYDPAKPKSGALFLKMLKPISLSPYSYSWDLMMKNVYNLGTTSIQKDNFRLEIAYRSDTLGTEINYLPEGRIKNKQLLRVTGLDKLNVREQPHPDGIFDFLEGYTIRAQTGRVYFPVVEPFGRNLRDSIGNDALAKKYVYQELYDSTLTVARQVAEKNKYLIRGSYRGSASDSEIDLGATNVPPGSVQVMAGGTKLVENVDYTVDYMAGKVKILNQAILDANTPLQVSSEGRSFSMQRKTMMGVNLNYDFSKNFTLGGTLMHYYERPMTLKETVGNESVKNTLWGLNTSYRTESMWLTNLVDKIPFVNATAPSQISLNAEFAQMLPGHYQNKEMGGYSYLDDFETSESKIDLKSPYAWSLASTPSSNYPDEAKLMNNINNGKSRAMLSWFIIDPLFTRRNSSLTPQHIKQDLDQLSNHFVREVSLHEIFPGRDLPVNQSSSLPVLNLSYYPQERGPYNLDPNVSAEGKFLDPEKRWGGITRKMDVRDFEAANVEYIEFWLMDPFAVNNDEASTNQGGELYFNLGDISEDVLKDGRKFYENGLPLDDDPDAVDYTVWGKVPKRPSTVYAFDNQTKEARRKQDVGLNGLSTEEEFNYAQFPTYTNYLRDFQARLSGDALQAMRDNPQSPLNDPAGDTYHFYRGGDYDDQEKSILDRYKYYNNTEGNSVATEDSNERYSTAARSTPDVEDVDQDNTLNETESFFQYKVVLKPNNMKIGPENHIVDIREYDAPLRNGKTGNVKWYLFKIPIKSGNKTTHGNIRDFKSIRFMRMFLSGFKQETFLRFGTLNLVRGEWRTYERPLNQQEKQGYGVLDVSTVNIEENSTRLPVNYILPPGLSQDLDPGQMQITKENEQALSMRVLNLEPEDARAVYKNTHYDLRRYRRLQLFTHLEEVVGKTDLKRGDLTVFLRLGSDYKNNYYEYEIPLAATPHGTYSNNNNMDRERVWPKSNMFDFPLDLLKNVKLARNKAMRNNSSISFVTPYWEYDPDKRNNRVTVVGNPSLSDVDVIMVGVRNNTRVDKSGEVWINELRLTDFDEEGGWAAQGNMHISLSDLATVDFSGRKETVGFGGLEQSLMERRQDDYEMYNVATSVDMGRFIPEKAKVSIPFNFAFSKEIVTPKYDPFDKDVTLKESLKIVDTKHEKDSIKSLARERIISKSMSLNNVRVNIASKTPMPYDPANFSFSYGFNKSETNTPTLVYDKTADYRAAMNYSYSPLMKTWEPFKNVKGRKGAAKFAKTIGVNYLPSNISFNSNITRFYTETVMRDIESYRLGSNTRDNEFLSWSQSFYWDRDFSINWDFTRNLKFTFNSGTRAEIEEPYLQVNKKQNRNDYEIWRDEVWRSIKQLGTPLEYRQTASLIYELPLKNIPALNWISNSTVSYNSGYNWDRGAVVDTLEIGNTISNQMTLDFNNRLNLVTLYNKSAFLKKVNDRFDERRRPTPNRRPAPEKKKRAFKQTVRLREDTTTTIKHNLNTKKLEVLAFSGKQKYKLKFKKVDENTIIITTKDTALVVLNIDEKEPKEMSKVLVEISEYSARALMSVRSLNINYSRRNETHISGFKPMIGSVFGQGNTHDYGYAPGVGFGFGLQGGPSYIEKSLRRDWLVMNEINVTPAIYNQAEKLDMRADVVPFKGMRINLTASRENNKRTEIQYMYDGSPQTLGGSFSISTISLSSSFKKSKASNNYQSDVFQKFLDNRAIVHNRVESRYTGTHYPTGGFMSELPGLAGKEYNPNVNSVNPNSADVLIPAFLAAYTGKDARKISLSAFPSLSSILPNWTMTYDGLSSMTFLKDKLKALQFTHGYNSFYQVGGYNSHTSWVKGNSGEDIGFIRDVLTGQPVPSSPYDISSVSISEAFNPLFGINGTLNNNLSINAQFNKARVLNLNISAYQIVESLQNEFIVGLGYRIMEFNRLIGLTPKKSEGFNNDLTLKADLSNRSNYALIRKIEDNYTQATSGTTTLTLMFSADYSISRALTLRAFFDRVLNKPLISANSYPTTNTNFGISVRFTLIE